MGGSCATADLADPVSLEDRGGLRRGLHYLGLDVSRHPLRYRDHSAVPHGRVALPAGRGDAVRLGADAWRGPTPAHPLALSSDHRRAAAARRQRRRDVGRAAHRVRAGRAARPTVPIWIAALDWLRPGGTRPDGPVIAGLLLGFVGILLLV